MQPLSVETVLGLTGLVILVGLAGELVFHRTGIPSVLFLMGLGVLLGLILDFSALTSQVAVAGLALFASIVAVRWIVTEVIGRTTGGWTGRDRIFIASMFPRGVATAVMAFLPTAAGIPNTQSFHMYALTVITLGVVGMTVALAVHRRWGLSSRPEPISG